MTRYHGNNGSENKSDKGTGESEVTWSQRKRLREVAPSG